MQVPVLVLDGPLSWMFCPGKLAAPEIKCNGLNRHFAPTVW